MTFWSIVGQARRQTAGRMGPSTMERSNFLGLDWGPAIREYESEGSLLRQTRALLSGE